VVRYLVRRLFWLAVTLLGVACLIFFVIRLVPADVVDILLSTEVGGSYVNQDQMRAFFGLDVPAAVQFQRWMSDLLTGDLGDSFRTGQPVTATILQRLPVTAEVVFLGLGLAVVFGVPLGIVAAITRGRWLDTLLRPVSMIGLSVPSFWLGTVLLLSLSLYLPRINFLGYVPFWKAPLVNLKVMLLPCLALGLISGVGIMRTTRSAMLEVLEQDYIRTARAKGLTHVLVIGRHAVRNALLPVITYLGIEIGVLLGGTIVIEEIFALPGLGRLVVDAIKERDYPVVQGVTLMIALAFSLINLGTDLLYGLINPRVRYE
jgi:peptide/nickel transport system permease protein